MILGLRRLEDRIVFDADLADSDNQPSCPPLAPPDRLLVVDLAVRDADFLVASARDDVAVLVYDSRTDSLRELQDMIAMAAGDTSYSAIALASHGLSGDAALTVDVLNLSEMASNPELAAFFSTLSGLLAENGRIDLLGCRVGEGELGRDLIALLENTTGLDFDAIHNAGGQADNREHYLESDNADAADTYLDADAVQEFVLKSNWNYNDSRGLIHFEQSDRVITAGTSFRDQEVFSFHEDPEGSCAKLELAFTMRKNGQLLDLLDYLGFGDSLKYENGKFSFDFYANGTFYEIPGISYVDGILMFSLAYDGDSFEPYVLWLGDDLYLPISSILGGEFHRGDVQVELAVNLLFASIPKALESDVFTLTLSADFFSSEMERLGTTYMNTVNLFFETIRSPESEDTPASPTPVPTDPDRPPVTPIAPVPVPEVLYIPPSRPTTPPTPENPDEALTDDETVADTASSEIARDGDQAAIATDSESNDGGMFSGRREEEEILALYPEEFHADLKGVVTLVAEIPEMDQAFLDSINTSISELGETLAHFRSALTSMLGLLSRLADLTGSAEVLAWVEEAGTAHDRLLSLSTGHVAMLHSAVQNYRSLNPEMRDSVALDSIVELNAAIDEVNQEFRVIIAGMKRMSVETRALQSPADTAVLSAKIPAIREHMAAVSATIHTLHERRDSLFADLRNSATIAMNGQQ